MNQSNQNFHLAIFILFLRPDFLNTNQKENILFCLKILNLMLDQNTKISVKWCIKIFNKKNSGKF